MNDHKENAEESNDDDMGRFDVDGGVAQTALSYVNTVSRPQTRA